MKKQISNHNKRLCKDNEQSCKAEADTVYCPWPNHGHVNNHLDPNDLHALSRKGLWGLLVFVAFGVAAFMFQDFNLYQALPEPVLQVLGCPPPAIMIHLALTCYSFTIVVPVLIRMANGDKPVVGWRHLWCRLAFYFFYLVSMTLPENLLALVIIGIILYVIEQVGIWSYMYKLLRNIEVSG